MKVLLNIVLIVFTRLITAQTQMIGEKETFILSTFSNILANDEKLFIEKICTRQALVYMALKGREIEKDKREAIDKLMNTSYPSYLNEQRDRFSAIQKKLDEIGIVRNKIKVDSISFQADPDFKEKLSGTIYFRTDNNTEFFKANFKGMIKYEERYFVDQMYVPHIYVGPKNRIQTAGIKKQYIDTCLAKIKYILSITKNTISTGFYGDCLPCHCEKEYVSETDQADGVERIKKTIQRGVKLKQVK